MNQFEQRQAENYVSFDATMPLTPPNASASTNIENPYHPILEFLLAIGVFVSSLFFIGISAAFALLGYAAYKGFEVKVSEMIGDPTAIIVNLIAIFPAHLATLLVAWSIVTRGGKQPFLQTLGWKWNGFGFWVCLGTTIALYAIAFGIITITGEQENELIRVLQSSRTAVYLTAIMATFTAPLVEEVVYRGVMFPAFQRFFDWFAAFLPSILKWEISANLRNIIGNVGAVTLVTLLFALVHVPQYLPSYGTIIIITVLSLVLTVIRAWTQSLLPCFVIHTLFNGIQAILLIAEPYLPKGEAPAVDPLPSFVVWLNHLQ